MAFGNQGHAAFATFLILCPTSFFLGILFSLFPYDYPLLWTSADCPPSAFANSANHLQFLYNSPPVISRILHIVIGTGILGFLIKLYRPSESNKLFDGASLMLYMCGVIVYVTNIVKGMKIVDSGSFDEKVVEGDLPVGVKAGPESLGREDSLRVVAASNTILALVLVGVLVLQAGQWYAERKDRQEMEKARLEKEKARSEKAASNEGNGNRHRSPNGSKKKN